MYARVRANEQALMARGVHGVILGFGFGIIWFRMLWIVVFDDE